VGVGELWVEESTPRALAPPLVLWADSETCWNVFYDVSGGSEVNHLTGRG